MSGALTNIDFASFPVSSWRVPGAIAEIDNSRANTGQITQRSLIVAQMESTGTAPPGIPLQVNGLAAAQAAFGATSMCVQMITRYRVLDPYGELWVLPLADVGTAATGTITIAGTPAAAGTLYPRIGGVPEATVVGTTDTPTTMAARLAGLINIDPLMMVTATAALGVVTLTARHLGLLGNDIDLRMNYLGVAGGETPVAGVTVTFAPMAGGTGFPNVAAALATLNTRTFDFIAMPYTAATSLNAMGTFLNDTSGRWSPLQELFGHCFSAFRGTLGAKQTLGNSRNDQHVSIMGFYDSPSTVWDWTADLTAACAVSQRADPGIPLQYMALNVLAPPDQSLDQPSVRNSLLYDGISTFNVVVETVQTENIITTYQFNIAGQPDDSYLEAERLGGLTLLIRDMRSFILSNFARKKLVIDGTPIPTGSAMVTSQTVLAGCVARYRQQCIAGNAQDPDGFAQAAAGQNKGNGTIALLLPFRLVNQLRLTAMLIQFQAL